jgi:hypothetical protein
MSIIRYSKNERTQSFGNWICFRPQMRGDIPTLLGPLERANLNSRHLKTETDLVSETLCSQVLEYRTMAKNKGKAIPVTGRGSP